MKQIIEHIDQCLEDKNWLQQHVGNVDSNPMVSFTLDWTLSSSAARAVAAAYESVGWERVLIRNTDDGKLKILMSKHAF